MDLVRRTDFDLALRDQGDNHIWWWVHRIDDTGPAVGLSGNRSVQNEAPGRTYLFSRSPSQTHSVSGWQKLLCESCYPSYQACRMYGDLPSHCESIIYAIDGLIFLLAAVMIL